MLDILITSIESRTAGLRALLGHLAVQWVDGVGVRIFRDNLEAGPFGDVRQRVLESSDAEYVCWLDDDDEIADDYLPTLMAALDTRPDYVGFKAITSYDGVWGETVSETMALPSTRCPMRRDIAMLGSFAGDRCEDRRWARQVLASGALQTEVFIDRWLYWYRWNSQDSGQTNTLRRIGKPVPCPVPPFVTWV